MFSSKLHQVPSSMNSEGWSWSLCNSQRQQLSHCCAAKKQLEKLPQESCSNRRSQGRLKGFPNFGLIRNPCLLTDRQVLNISPTREPPPSKCWALCPLTVTIMWRRTLGLGVDLSAAWQWNQALALAPATRYRQLQTSGAPQPRLHVDSQELYQLRLHSSLGLIKRLCKNVKGLIPTLRIAIHWDWNYKMSFQYKLGKHSKKNTGLFGNFSQHRGGEGVFPIPKTFVILP